MRKILVAIFIMVICFFIFLLVGWSEEKKNRKQDEQPITKISDETSPRVVQPETINIKENETSQEHENRLYSNEGTLKSIYSILATDKNILEISWATNNKYVMFVRGNPIERWGDAYIWKVGQNEPIYLFHSMEPIGGFSWSPNSEYVLMDVGTSPMRGGYVITIIDLSVGEPFSYMNASFSPDSKYLALGTPSDHYISDVALSPGEAFDLSIYNNETAEMEIIVPTDDVHNLYPVKWLNNKTIVYKKVYVSIREETELSVTIDDTYTKTVEQLKDEAARTLLLYFEALTNKSYDVMATLYGGTNVELEGFSLPSETDPEILMKNYCESVGIFVDIKEIVNVSTISDDEYILEVIHVMEDGSLFSEYSPYARKTYTYTVKKIEGDFKVIGLPPYIS